MVPSADERHPGRRSRAGSPPRTWPLESLTRPTRVRARDGRHLDVPLRTAPSRPGRDRLARLSERGPVARRAAGVVPDGMIDGMTTTKIAVSLPAELVEQAHRAVAEGRASSVSAYVADALAEKAKLDDLALLLEEMLAETGGPLTAKERRSADRALGR
jgi:Arc/MetJ-type ribon-helix-helix transcriptional regulator